MRHTAPALIAFSLVLWVGTAALGGYQFYKNYHTPETAPDIYAKALANIEPAAGGHKKEESVENKHGGGTGDATANKKDENALPEVIIGSLRVAPYQQQATEIANVIMPPDLRDASIQIHLNRRIRFTPYAHDPIRGSADAQITMVEFIDLACVQCRPSMKDADTVYTNQPGKIRHVSMHLPLSLYSDTNMLAFYGKVAQRAGKYWEYREALINSKIGAKEKETSVEDAFNLLMGVGIDQAEARRWVSREARRYYRELDADAKLARALGLSDPPHFYLNGIHVGEHGIPRDRISSVADWLLGRKQYRLDNDLDKLIKPIKKADTETSPTEPKSRDSAEGSSHSVRASTTEVVE